MVSVSKDLHLLKLVTPRMLSLTATEVHKPKSLKCVGFEGLRECLS